MHPIVETIQPNDEQQPAVLERGRDIVVTAGAGTGKTRTLVSRYLSLLADDIPVRTVVAITFTRKAAREMRNRVRATMRDFIDRADMSSEQRRLWTDRYNQLDAARIGTIHSLCTEILRAHPAEAGVDPRFEVLDEGEAGILLAQAIDQGLSWAADDEKAVQLFSFLGEWKLRSLVEALMGKRLEAQEALAALPEDVWPLWRDLLVPKIRSFVDSAPVRADFNDLKSLKVDGTLSKAEAAGDALVPHLVQLLEHWELIEKCWADSDWAGISAHLYPLRQSMKIKGKKGSWSPADPKAIIKELQLSYDESLGELGDKHFNLGLDQEWANLLPGLSRLFDQVSQFYRIMKGQGQKLDYDDLESGALRLLRDFPEVQARWQEDIKAILVDEFQDTNSRQRDLVNLMAGHAGKLLIVGDAKQSIYRFRGADVAVFRAERARVDHGDGLAFELSTSYRAHRDLLNGLNDILRPVLGDEDDPDRPWREPFSSLRHHREQPRDGIAAPFIELHLTAGSKSDGALHRAAEALAGHLLELVNGEGSSIGFGDIVILCRASTSFGAYESALDEAGVPYLTVAGRGFYDRPEIRDLLNMLQAVSEPADDLALAGLLRSPVVGYSDFDLVQLVDRWNETDRVNPLWQLLQESTEPKAARIIEIIRDLHDRAGRISVANVLEEFVNRTDYRAALLSSGNARAARNVTKLLVDAHNSGIVGIGEFLTYVQGLRSGPAREGEAPATAGDAVRIMTVHAAKGLEFPVVVIGDVNYGRIGSADLLLDPDLGVFPKLTDDDGAGSGIFQLLQKREQDQEDAESDRLLYVAATRAQDKLILSGCIRLSGTGRPGWLKGWMKKLSDPLGLGGQEIVYNEDGGQVRRLALTVGETAVGCLIYEPQYMPGRQFLQSQADWAEAGIWSPRLVEPVPMDAQEATREPPERAWYIFGGEQPTRAPGLVIGTLVHEALAAWRFPGPGFKQWVKARAQSQGLTGDEQIADAINRVSMLLKRFEGHELYKTMESAERRLSEVPFDRVNAGGQPVHGIIDALFLKDGIWTIVEYKTDELKDEDDFNRVLYGEGYVNQVLRYASAIQALTGRKPQTVLCLLDYRGEIRLHPEPDWL